MEVVRMDEEPVLKTGMSGNWLRGSIPFTSAKGKLSSASGGATRLENVASVVILDGGRVLNLPQIRYNEGQ